MKTLLDFGVYTESWTPSPHIYKFTVVIPQTALSYPPLPLIICWRRGISCLRTGTGTQTDSKGFCENSGLKKGISGETPGFMETTYSRLERVFSVTSPSVTRKRYGDFFTVYCTFYIRTLHIYRTPSMGKHTVLPLGAISHPPLQAHLCTILGSLIAQISAPEETAGVGGYIFLPNFGSSRKGVWWTEQSSNGLPPHTFPHPFWYFICIEIVEKPLFFTTSLKKCRAFKNRSLNPCPSRIPILHRAKILFVQYFKRLFLRWKSQRMKIRRLSYWF